MKRLLAALTRCCHRRAGLGWIRGGPSARKLHRQPLRGDRGVGRDDLRSRGARPGRDSHLSDWRPRSLGRLRGGARARSRAVRRWSPLWAAGSRAPRHSAAGRRWSEDAASGRGLPGPGDRTSARVPRPVIRIPNRLARDHAFGARRRGGRDVLRACTQQQRCASLLSAEHAQLAARRAICQRRRRSRRRSRRGAFDRDGRNSGALGWRLRGSDRSGPAVGRGGLAVAARRSVLGCRPRAHPGARKGSRRRLPRGDPWEARAMHLLSGPS